MFYLFRFLSVVVCISSHVCCDCKSPPLPCYIFFIYENVAPPLQYMYLHDVQECGQHQIFLKFSFCILLLHHYTILLFHHYACRPFCQQAILLCYHYTIRRSHHSTILLLRHQTFTLLCKYALLQVNFALGPILSTSISLYLISSMFIFLYFI